ncbi:MAG TPA: primosomal protein N' [Spongiibacteraceae bacterium]|jgi:primosomal protein N' (replication factor Y)|nr:primosomal protein N' [Spongiibacteraceae bacterium]HUH38031.1 primosomal protein N' [Spongiibacteraceae bacterium]
MPILRLALPCPLRRLFDYLPPAGVDVARLRPGQRLQVPFGRRQSLGLLVEIAARSALPAHQLRAASAVLDAQPVLDEALLKLVLWAADYYQHPVGDALFHALPVLMRQGPLRVAEAVHWRLTERGMGLPAGALQRAPRQAQALAALQAADSVSLEALVAQDIAPAILKALADKGLAERFHAAAPAVSAAPAAPRKLQAELVLNAEQAGALAAVNAALGRYACLLLEGVTGSGKTEVYLQAIAEVLRRGQRALVLVPEIGLTPQTLARFRARLGCEVAVLHSGLSDRERLAAWQCAADGEAGVVIGTRSAVFTPLAGLGLVIVDEEHDASYKAQDGFRYSARDLAIKRAADAGCPVLLGTATPSLESLNNALGGRYQHLRLRERAGGALAPRMRVLDIRGQVDQAGLSDGLLAAMAATLGRGEQVLAFINRRGFSPALQCSDCGWLAECAHCDARLTVHAAARRLRCHHCGHQQALPGACPTCASPALDFRGPGTERCEQVLAAHFPRVPVLRIDRDSTQRKGSLERYLAQIQRGEPCILVGTQMLAKGHHFPAVTLVAVLDADGGLFSADYRATERMGQTLMQVAGRAGRAERPGEVIVQSRSPDHPLLEVLLADGYNAFARVLLGERRQLGLPPFCHLALLRAEARSLSEAEDFLVTLREQATADGAALEAAGVRLTGPLPAPMARRAGRYRAQLALQSRSRGRLNQVLGALCALAERAPTRRDLRWAVDVDPVEW